MFADTRRTIRAFSFAALATLSGCGEPPTVVFEDGFESGAINLERWEYDRKGTCEIDHPEGGARDGNRVVRFRAGTDARCEIVPWFYPPVLDKLVREPYGEDRWYAFSVRLQPPYPPNPQNEVLAQWHSSRDWFFGEPRGRGPVLALRIEDGQWRITHGSDAEFVSEKGYKAKQALWTGPVEAGRWIDWVVRARWSHRDDGETEIWMDGVRVASHRGPNAYNDVRGVYLKLGIYHPGAPREILLDEVRIGAGAATLETVTPKSARP